ncbi:hypothetical protein [Mangrovimonas aestuarii]|uniref:hypothetical protein n=1 Tax=Mangrovimonas aestuarii TaxID=3018443 RepID=UPI0023797BEC|nr:hypothetical protein [Mangrovimonas aestuarii]
MNGKGVGTSVDIDAELEGVFLVVVCQMGITPRYKVHSGLSRCPAKGEVLFVELVEVVGCIVDHEPGEPQTVKPGAGIVVPKGVYYGQAVGEPVVRVQCKGIIDVVYTVVVVVVVVEVGNKVPVIVPGLTALRAVVCTIVYFVLVGIAVPIIVLR